MSDMASPLILVDCLEDHLCDPDPHILDALGRSRLVNDFGVGYDI